MYTNILQLIIYSCLYTNENEWARGGRWGPHLGSVHPPRVGRTSFDRASRNSVRFIYSELQVQTFYVLTNQLTQGSVKVLRNTEPPWKCRTCEPPTRAKRQLKAQSAPFTAQQLITHTDKTALFLCTMRY